MICNFLGLSSAANIIPSFVFIPSAIVPRLTVSMAYSTWYSLPSGEKTVQLTNSESLI